MPSSGASSPASMKVLVMRGIGRGAKISRRPLPVGGMGSRGGLARCWGSRRAGAGWSNGNEGGVLPVLEVAAQDAVLDQHRSTGGRALVVDVERAASARE